MSAFAVSSVRVAPTMATRAVAKQSSKVTLAAAPMRASAGFAQGASLAALKASKMSASVRVEGCGRSTCITCMAFPIKAVCNVSPKGAPCNGAEEKAVACTGTVTFEQTSADSTTITWDIKNCGTGEHGFHIHEFSDFSDGCMSAGPHYNPHGCTHGAPSDETRHVGDLGNIVGDGAGNSAGSVTDALIKLEGEFSVLGRSVMVHADPDDCGTGDHSEPGTNGKTSLTTGNAGARIACGEILLA